MQVPPTFVRDQVVLTKYSQIHENQQPEINPLLSMPSDEIDPRPIHKMSAELASSFCASLLSVSISLASLARPSTFPFQMRH